MSEVHAQARTTPRTRAEINASSATVAELAERYNISLATVRKWKRRDSPGGRSHRPVHSAYNALAYAIELRRLLLLPLNDLLVVMREFVNPHGLPFWHGVQRPGR